MFAYWPAPELRSKLTFCRRIDLARSAGTDFEQLVLTIRLGLAARVGRPLPAFDPALRRLSIRDDGTDADYDLALVTTDPDTPATALVTRYAWR